MKKRNGNGSSGSECSMVLYCLLRRRGAGTAIPPGMARLLVDYDKPYEKRYYSQFPPHANPLIAELALSSSVVRRREDACKPVRSDFTVEIHPASDDNLRVAHDILLITVLRNVGC